MADTSDFSWSLRRKLRRPSPSSDFLFRRSPRRPSLKGSGANPDEIMSPAVRFASSEDTESPDGRKPQVFDQSLQMVEGIEIGTGVERSTGQFPGILAPNPNALPPIPPKYFSPPSISDNSPPNYTTSFSHLLRCISDATSRREESEAAYHHLLQKIFEEGQGGLHTDPEIADAELLAILESEKAFGREQEMEKLLLKCCNPDEDNIQLSAIPIVGAAGIGKTTLAQLIYGNRSVQDHFEIRVWVKVDGQEFNLHHAAQQILKSAMQMPCSIDGLDEMVRDVLRGQRCLIVFDGVESMTEDLWLYMNNYWFDFVDLGSIVLITTPSKGVASLVTNEQPFELKQLFPFQVRSLYRYLSLDTIVIVKGIPLLLTLVVSMMGCHNKLRKILSQGEFSDVIFPSTFDASAVILLCIWALPTQLRQCLAFCAVFPIDYAFDRVKIINMWVAHGLVKPSPKKNLYNVGDSYFNELLCRSFFTDIARNDYGDITEVRMPKLIHNITRDVAGIVWKRKVGVIVSVSDDSHLLSLVSGGPEGVTSLILSSTLYSGASSLDYTFLEFQELESLDLSCSGIQNLSNDICALKELKYLNLSYTLIEGLPDSITHLWRLQTLDLSWCYHFKVVPKAIGNLTCMSHLDLSHCESLSRLPSEIGFLVSLTSLPLFVLGKDRDSAGLEELGMLNQLCGRLDIRNLENVREISEARDAKLHQKQLHHLELCWSKDADDCFEVLKLLEPNPHLKVINITGYMGSRFPRWISSTCTSLIKISITDCGCVELPTLGHLPLLKELQLKEMANIQYIGPEFYGYGVIDAFPSLEQLGLYDMPSLLEWSGAGGYIATFRRLKTLTIESCPLLAYTPTFIDLCELIVCNSKDEILSSLKRSRFSSLSSLLIKNMGLGTFFKSSSRWSSLKKLTLFNCLTSTIVEIEGFVKLQHLGILHCPQLGYIILHHPSSIQKLHVADCKDLQIIEFPQEATELIQLVVEGCSELLLLINSRNLPSLPKLLITSGDEFIRAGFLKMLKKLRYVYISECPLLEKELEMEPPPVSHIPFFLLGNHKVEYRGSNHFDQEDTMSTLFESEYDSRQESTFKGSSSPGSTIFELPR